MNLTTLSSEMDVEVALDRLCGDSALLLEILDMFLTEFIAEQPNFQDLLRQSDWAALSRKAHYFKGVAENLGLTRFSSEILSLEQFSNSANLAACIQTLELLMQIAQNIQSLRKALQND